MTEFLKVSQDYNIRTRLEQDAQFLLDKGYDILGVFLYGSQNYGMATEGSDIDTKAVVLPSVEQIVMGKKIKPKKYDTPDGAQIDVKDVRDMLLDKYLTNSKKCYIIYVYKGGKYE